MTTTSDIADFMIGKLRQDRVLYEPIIACEIKNAFGDNWVSVTPGLRIKIRLDVLKEFAKLSPPETWSPRSGLRRSDNNHT
ncbi:MAG: hypothetical protein BGP04_03105 [Rhizobiales bacterium 62-17]|nr:hypothetical protein [Hyphomicrobiales bacterium]OJY04404.1 MAG: hypothetical protein BGP04_03105 [Rhizobiales bacterium 62-17]